MCVLYYVMLCGVTFSHVFMFILRLCITNMSYTVISFLSVWGVFSPVWLCHSLLATVT